MDAESSNRSVVWVGVGAFACLALAVAVLFGVRSAGSSAAERDMLGERWNDAPSSWGIPLASANSVSITARESAARRPKGDSGLVIPHADLLVDGPRPVHGPGARASNPFLIFTDDGDAIAFLRKVTTGTLAGSPGEYRTAIDRAGPIRIVRIDGAGRVRRIEAIRPVFITAVVEAR